MSLNRMGPNKNVAKIKEILAASGDSGTFCRIIGDVVERAGTAA